MRARARARARVCAARTALEVEAEAPRREQGEAALKVGGGGGVVQVVDAGAARDALHVDVRRVLPVEGAAVVVEDEPDAAQAWRGRLERVELRGRVGIREVARPDDSRDAAARLVRERFNPLGLRQPIVGQSLDVHRAGDGHARRIFVVVVRQVGRGAEGVEERLERVVGRVEEVVMRVDDVGKHHAFARFGRWEGRRRARRRRRRAPTR